jgi:hypothetical protein
MPGDLGDLPGAELRKNAFRKRFALVAEPRNFLVDVDFGIIANEAQLLDLGSSILASSSAIGCSKSRNFRSIACVFDVFCTHCKPEDGLYMISRPGV